MNKKNAIIMTAVAVVFATGGFFAGLKYAQAKKPTAQAALQRGGGRTAATFVTRAAPTDGSVDGSIVSKDATSITVKSMDGSSKVVLLGGSTTISKSTAGTADDLATGTDVLVTGTTNSDGSVTAQNVQIRPAGAPGFGGPGGPP